MRILIALLAYATIAVAQPDSLHVIWDKRGYGDAGHFGGAVFALGDQNNDGNADFAVVSGGMGLPGDPSEPRFDLFHGGNPPDTIPYMTFKGSASESRYLYQARTIGDVNGDGYVDWWTWNYTIGDSLMHVWFFLGGPYTDTIPNFVFGFWPNQGHNWMYSIGDINGDHYDDFYLYWGLGEGRGTYLFYGGSQPDTVPSLFIPASPPCSSLPVAYGDFNGDGYCDFVTATGGQGSTTCFFLGGAQPDTVAAYTWSNFDAYPAMLTDLNGDGKADLVISRGGVQRDYLDVYLGRDTLSPVYDYRLFFDGCDNMANFLFSEGDINHDGFNDLVAISDGCNLGFGGLQLYLGHPWLNSDPAITINGGEAPLDLVGIRCAVGLGDVDDDGVQDWAIGATNDMTYGQGRRGRVVILRGDTTLRVDACEPRASIPRSLDVTVFPNPFNGEATILLNVPLFAPQVKLTLYNLLGQTVHEATLQGVSGQTRYSLSVPFLPSGVYLLKVQSGPLFSTQKIMLLR